MDTTTPGTSDMIQPALLPEIEAIEAEERRGEWTLERLKVRRPEALEVACRMIAEGLSTLSIARALKMSPNSILRIREKLASSIDDHKEELRRLAGAAARLTIERVIELAPTMKAGEASVAFGITSEKYLLLGGEATSIVATKGDQAAHADFNALLSALPAANVTEIATTGSSGETAEQKAARGESHTGDKNLSGDDESLACPHVVSASNTQGNTSASVDRNSKGSKEGGRGSAIGGGIIHPNSSHGN